MSEPLTPRQLAKAIQESFADLTVERARKYIADDCVVHEAPSLPFGGDWKGPEGFVELMGKITTTFKNFHSQPISMVSDDTTVAFAARISGDAAHGRFSIPLVEYWTCRDGKIVEIFAMWQDTKLVMDLHTGTKS